MANVKKVTIGLTSVMSEVTMDALLAKTNTHKGAATVVRDENGKVTKVVISLPPTASSKAQQALEATPGVSTVEIQDIIPGTVGFDGTEEGLNELLANGWKVEPHYMFAYPTIAYADGISKHTNVTSGTPYSWTLASPYNALPRYPNGFEVEFKVKMLNAFADVTSNAFCGVVAANEDSAFSLGPAASWASTDWAPSLGYWNGSAWISNYNTGELTAPLDVHVYKAVVDETQALKMYVDDDLIHSSQLGTGAPHADRVTFQTYVGPSSNAGFDVDYFRFTERV